MGIVPMKANRATSNQRGRDGGRWRTRPCCKKKVTDGLSIDTEFQRRCTMITLRIDSNVLLHWDQQTPYDLLGLLMDDEIGSIQDRG